MAKRSYNPLDRLTAQQALLCIAYVRSPKMDIVEAGAEVGMTPKQAKESIRTNQYVCEYIDELIKQRAARLLIDADVVVVELLETAQAARTRGFFREAIEAYQLLGRHFRMFPAGEQGSNGTPNIYFNNQVALEAQTRTERKKPVIPVLPSGSECPVPDADLSLPEGNGLESIQGIIDATTDVPGCDDSPGFVPWLEDT